MDLQDESVLMELECLVCREYLFPPISLCRTGHSMCENCRRKLTICPICDATLGNARNFALESLISKFMFPCKYKNAGCEVSEIGDKLRMHEEFCEHGEIGCPLHESSGCLWTGKVNDLVIHAGSYAHQPHIFDNCVQCLQGVFSFIGDSKWYSLVNANCKTFKYCFNVNSTKSIAQWNVQFVGPREEANSYVYMIILIDKQKKKQQFAVKSTCEPLGNDSLAFMTGTCVKFNKLQQFCDDDGNLYFYFKISRTELADSLVDILLRNIEDANAVKPKRPKLFHNPKADSDAESKECVNINLLDPVFQESSELDDSD